MDKKIVIEKVDDSSVKSKVVHKKTVKSFPKGILKKTSKLSLKGVSDPAKSPPLKKGMQHHTLRMLTEKGSRKHRKTLKRKLSKMKTSEVADIAKRSGLVLNPKTPPHIAKAIVGEAVSAGFLSM
jgi:hypothetical protein